MSKNYDNWERLVKATLLREELRRICREDSLSSTSSFSSSDYSTSFQEPESPIFVDPSSDHGMSFSYRQISVATLSFSDEYLIRRGHTGDFFKVVLPQLSSEPVVVKRIHVEALISSELWFLSRIDSHPRFVSRLGHSFENGKNKLLVYRYLPERDLTSALFKKHDYDVHDDDGVDYRLPSLDWITRLKIARGVAEGLAYLHHDCKPPLVHGDVQASTVLLDHGFEVRLGSLSQGSIERIRKDKFTFPWRPKKETSDKNKTTCSYDVYCFGKVLLELVTGRLGISSTSDANVLKEYLESTLPYISIYDKELVINIIDPTLIVDEDLFEEVWAMGLVARSCLNPDPSKRAQMKDILEALENPTKVVRDEDKNIPQITVSRDSWNAAAIAKDM